MAYRKHIIIGGLILLLIYLFSMNPVIAESEHNLTMDYYYGSTCGECITVLNNLIEPRFIDNETYQEFLTIDLKDIDTNDTVYQQWMNFTPRVGYPVVVIRNQTTSSAPIEIYDSNLEKGYTDIVTTINKFLQGNISDNETDKNENIISTPWGNINVSSLSLPVMTLILGGLDSFNPCAFFILIFLLNLLIYARSRRRMILIGGIFIFFSGFLYMLFMFLLFEFLRAIKTPENVYFITIIVALIVLPMGLLNIKDFFFFKKGASLSIPEDKKPKIYKQMRALVKHQRIGATIIGTIILAATVNFYELLCTLGLPFAFIEQLSRNSITQESAAYYLYILFYNIVYVIPLIIIVSLFVITLGKRKLTEWHGQIMKLISGIMLSSFGIIFLVDYQLLENVLTPIIMLLISLALTAVISIIWKKMGKNKPIENKK
jgi:hypothetical protein